MLVEHGKPFGQYTWHAAKNPGKPKASVVLFDIIINWNQAQDRTEHSWKMSWHEVKGRYDLTNRNNILSEAMMICEKLKDKDTKGNLKYIINLIENMKSLGINGSRKIMMCNILCLLYLLKLGNWFGGHSFSNQ